MRDDPRCPACDGKVSATATWCMHCGADFDEAGDAGSAGEVTVERATAGSPIGAGTESARPDRPWEDAGGEYAGDAAPGLHADPPETIDGIESARDLVAFVAADESRRIAVAVGVPTAVWLFFGLGTPTPLGSLLSLIGATGLAVYLYARGSALDTLVGSASGAGVVVLGVTLLETAVFALGDGFPVSPAALDVSPFWLVVGAGLVAAGRRLRSSFGDAAADRSY